MLNHHPAHANVLSNRDWQKLIFYYYADHFINFKGLVNDLYKLYKVRLWISAVNPASFSPNAINQPSTGTGPGAITSPAGGSGFDTSYTMASGPIRTRTALCRHTSSR